MRIFKLLCISAVCLFLVSSCGKSSNPPATSLQFTVLDEYGNQAPGAIISLYKSQNDYLDNVNLLASATTDNYGVATFTNLNASVYYYYIAGSTDCSNNNFTSYYTPNALQSGITNNVSVLIYKTGQMKLTNFSSDPYDVYFNGTLWGTVNGKSYTTATVKTGPLAIHIKQASGFVSNPKEEDFTANVSSCDNLKLDFP